MALLAGIVLTVIIAGVSSLCFSCGSGSDSGCNSGYCGCGICCGCGSCCICTRDCNWDWGHRWNYDDSYGYCHTCVGSENGYRYNDDHDYLNYVKDKQANILMYKFVPDIGFSMVPPGYLTPILR